MKKLIYACALSLAVLTTSCGPQIYKAANFEQVKKKHSTLAILPFEATTEMKRLPKGTTIEAIQANNKSTGYAVQSNSYAYLLRQFSKNKYTVSFQDVDQTNALLAKNGITYEDLATKSKGEICELLGVDGVISGKIRMSKPMSDGAAVAMALLAGAWGPTNKTDVSMTIHDKTESKLLWKYDYMATGNLGSSSEQLSRALMKNVSKKFPYKS